MDEPHGASGKNFPNRSARRSTRGGTGLACALFVPATAQGDEPAGPRILPAVAAETASGRVDSGAARRNDCRRSTATSSRLTGAHAYVHISNAELLDGSPTRRQPGQLHCRRSRQSDAEQSAHDAQSDARSKPLFKFSGMQEPQSPPSEDEDSQPVPRELQAASRPNQQTYGQAPTNNALQFLRDVDVLLELRVPGRPTQVSSTRILPTTFRCRCSTRWAKWST